MTVARCKQISLVDTKYYHCISRCVRRAFLCGVDSYTGKSYEHRKQWVEDKIVQLTQIFCIDICAFAIMSNHLHLVVHIDDKKAKNLSDREIASRWHHLFQGSDITKKFLNDVELNPSEQIMLKNDIEKYRARLFSISWFMRILNEDISRRANKEDGCTGHFWEGRFKSQALLDHAALAACMAYVDLNPIRANMVKSPEKSEHTSIRKRMDSKKDGSRFTSLLPFVNESKSENAVHLPFEFQSYFELLKVTSQCMHRKQDFLTNSVHPMLEKLGFSAENWITLTDNFTRVFHGPVGNEKALNRYCERLGLGRKTTLYQCQRYLS